MLTDSQINSMIGGYAPGVNLSQKSIRDVRKASMCVGMNIEDSATKSEEVNRKSEGLPPQSGNELKPWY